MATKIINLSLDDELLKLLDKAAADVFASRSEYMRQLIVQKVKPTPKEDWDEYLEMMDDIEARASTSGYDDSFADGNRAVKDYRASLKQTV